ncbi:protein-disulfide reductase DsbD domain-containing protein [Celeribacter naphthalenivorans]|uniref:protein-disulfide reductase DsbD domain-containing protein n=1 Tax=Celeribacter naphthalenivorans TaxID=1614694 RepID=UPI001CFA4FFC|nr:protein-disulfide reductase DsbD domain-containing protein [Celeribacter naphthalenivorans]
MKTPFAPLATALCLALSAPAAHAQEASDMARIDILPGWQMDNGHRMAAIRIRLAPGWHTYWRSPGESGIPPSFNLAGSDNLSHMELHWPVPELFSDNGMWYLGYEHELILPIELVPEANGAIRLNGTMDLGVCNDICMPMQAQLNATLTPEGKGSMNNQIKAALADRPTPVANVKCDAAPLRDGMRLTAHLNLPSLPSDAVAVIEHPDHSVWVSEAQMQRKGGTVEVQSDLVPAEAQPFFIDRSALTISVIGGGRAYEAQGCTGS